jgi:hypothetical protein
MPGRDKLVEFVHRYAAHITGDERGHTQIFLHGPHQHNWTPLPDEEAST